MAKILIGNVRGKDGRGIKRIEKTATTGSVDTYTITYSDNTTSTFDVRNSDDIAIEGQILPSANIESGSTATHKYSVDDYVYVGGKLRRVNEVVNSGGTFTDGNSEVVTISDELVLIRKILPTIRQVGTGTISFYGATFTWTAYAVNVINSNMVCIRLNGSGSLTTSGKTANLVFSSTKLDTAYTPPSGTNFQQIVYSSSVYGVAYSVVVTGDGNVGLCMDCNKAITNYGIGIEGGDFYVTYFRPVR